MYNVTYSLRERWTEIHCFEVGNGGRFHIVGVNQCDPTHYTATKAGIRSASTCSVHSTPFREVKSFATEENVPQGKVQRLFHRLADATMPSVPSAHLVIFSHAKYI